LLWEFGVCLIDIFSTFEFGGGSLVCGTCAQKYTKLMECNEVEKGGSFYLQSKVFRARERLEVECKTLGIQFPPPSAAATADGASPATTASPVVAAGSPPSGTTTDKTDSRKNVTL
jgi:hypothetical protein